MYSQSQKVSITVNVTYIVWCCII